MSMASLVAAAATALERGLLTDTCMVTAVNADGSAGAAATVRCAIVQPSGQTGPNGGGGDQLARPGDVTIMLPRTTTVDSGYTIARGSETYSVGFVVAPKSHDPLLYAQCAETTP